MNMGIKPVLENAKGGTELLIEEFKQHIPENIYNHFQIVPSRLRGFETGKIPLYWAHDLVGDPECDHLMAGGFNQYEKIIFVSNWQMQQFISHYGIPWSKCVVIQNAINPIEPKQKSKEKINLIYHTTPHRGLEILAPVFIKLCEKYDNIELDVFSSFEIYGCVERDEEYKNVFELLKSHPKIRYHGFADQNTVREAVSNAHIFAYPSIWMETSCRCLMEAMSAKVLCVHSNYGCLYETAAGWTWMYQHRANKREHANILLNNLSSAIDNYWDDEIQLRIDNTATYANVFYSWEMRKHQWTDFLKSILVEKKINF